MPRSEKRTLYVASEFPNKKLSLSGGALAHRMRARIHTVRDVCGCTARCVDQHFSKTKRLRNVGSFCCAAIYLSIDSAQRAALRHTLSART